MRKRKRGKKLRWSTEAKRKAGEKGLIARNWKRARRSFSCHKTAEWGQVEEQETWEMDILMDTLMDSEVPGMITIGIKKRKSEWHGYDGGDAQHPQYRGRDCCFMGAGGT